MPVHERQVYHEELLVYDRGLEMSFRGFIRSNDFSPFYESLLGSVKILLKIVPRSMM